jgi:hypothetical protein
MGQGRFLLGGGEGGEEDMGGVVRQRPVIVE